MIETISQRRSVRSFQKTPLTSEDLTFIHSLMEEFKPLKGPFGTMLKWFFYFNEEGQSDVARQVGTYGFIKNAPAFIGAVVPNQRLALIDFGYLFELFILKLTGHQLGTVWLGGTFRRSSFNDLIKEGEVVPAISPIGYPEVKIPLKEQMMRFALQANIRKPFDTLFFYEKVGQPIPNNHPFYELLELVRKAPSGTNQQPWRILVQGTSMHLFLKRTPDYSKMLPVDLQLLDMGIALCHLMVGATEKNRKFQIYQSNISPQFPEAEYIATLSENLSIAP